MFNTEKEREVIETIRTLNNMLTERNEFEKLYEIQRLETAKYKCSASGKTELRRKIQEQIYENQNSFKLFPLSKGTFRTLEDMKNGGILTEEEYKKIK